MNFTFLIIGMADDVAQSNLAVTWSTGFFVEDGGSVNLSIQAYSLLFVLKRLVIIVLQNKKSKIK